MRKIVIYSSQGCPYCEHAKELLNKKGAKFEEIRVDLDPSQREEMIKKSGRRTVPQIFIDNQPIGGFDDLAKLEKNGQLDVLLFKVD